MAKEREELRRLASLTDSEGSQKLSREDKYDDSRKAAKRRRQERGGTMEGLAGTGFTAEDIDTLIVEAREKASGAEGSSQAWRHGDSHEETEFKLHHFEGSQQNAQAGSQEFHLHVQRRVDECLSSADGVIKVGSLGSLVVDVLSMLEKPSCRPRSITGKGDLFALPVAHFSHHPESHSAFLPAVLASLNSMHSFGETGASERLSPAARSVCKRLDEVVTGSSILEEPLPDLNFKSFFSSRGLDYSGEEVRLAIPIDWKSVESSLPPEVGCLDIRDFCSGGVAHFVNNIDETLLPVEDQVRLKTPSVMIQGDGWEEVACGLVHWGLCEVVSEESIYKVNNQPLLNGLFSVSKDEMKDDIPLARLIMNLKPWNMVSRCLTGDVGTLPSVTQLGSLHLQGQVNLKTTVEEKNFLEKGWWRTSQKPLPTFTTARPSSKPLRRPAGLRDCSEQEVQRWKDHSHRFPPYQYMDQHCLQDAQGSLRTPNIREREAIMGFPPNYTLQCMKKEYHGTVAHEDCRLSLVGNSWAVGVVAWLLQQLLGPLGVTSPTSLSDIMTELTPGKSPHLQTLLLRPPFGQANKTFSPSDHLAAKLAGLVSIKGEDLMLQSVSEVPVKHHRLRTGIPGRLWRWKPVSGWKWKGDEEHINVLEARAVLTTLKWRVLQHKQLNIRCVHRVDSLVVLHALTNKENEAYHHADQLLHTC